MQGEIRSFVLRQGRLTTAQQRAQQDLMPKYGIKFSPQFINLKSVFPSDQADRPTIIEIGCGMGQATLEIAENNPLSDYIGIEVHTPGIGKMCAEIANRNIDNLKLIQHDAIEVLQQMIFDHSIDGFHIFFPDPWPKKRHHKRRLIRKSFLQLLNQKIKNNGYVHIATDWFDYAESIKELFSEYLPKWQKLEYNTTSRPLTKFEQRGLRLGHEIYDLCYIAKID